MKIVADCNVIFSGLLWRGNPWRIVLLREMNKLELCGTKKTYDEFCRIITYPRLKKFIDKHNYSVRSLCIDYENLVTLYPAYDLKKTIIKADPSDDMFIEATVSSNSRIIVSGDSHLLDKKKFRDIHILSPKEFMELFTLLGGI